MFQATLKNLPHEDISVMITMDNHSWNYLVDCGQASQLTVRECQQIAAVFISHTHIDHFINFDEILRHQIGIGRRVVICGPEGIAKRVQSRILSYIWNLIEPGSILYEIREISEDGKIRKFELEPPAWELRDCGLQEGPLYRSDEFQVEYVLLDHKIPTVSYLFREDDKTSINLAGAGLRGGPWVRDLKAAFEAGNPGQELEIEGQQRPAGELFHLLEVKKGDTLGVIMDHLASEENHSRIQSLFEKARKVLIECFYKDEDKENALKNFHSFASASGNIMRICEVEEAVPVHFSRRYDEAEVEEVKAAFFKAFASK